MKEFVCISLMPVSQIFTILWPASQPVQPRVHPHPKVDLTLKACTRLKLNQHEKVEQFHKDLDNAWWLIYQTTLSIVSNNHRSVCCVQNNLLLSHSKFASHQNKSNAWNTFAGWSGMTIRHPSPMKMVSIFLSKYTVIFSMALQQLVASTHCLTWSERQKMSITSSQHRIRRVSLQHSKSIGHWKPPASSSPWNPRSMMLAIHSRLSRTRYGITS